MSIVSTQIFRATSLEDLNEIAKAFITKYDKPGIFLLDGEMGAGKTTFIKTVCKAMGADDATSPTFSLVNHYPLPGKPDVFHFDLYRLKNMEEALDFGFEEYLDYDAYIFIEWADVVRPLLTEGSVTINIREENGVREISF